MESTKRRTILIAIAALFFIGLVLVIFLMVRNNREKIVVDSIPKTLKLTLNGKEISNKGATVQPGTYTLEGSSTGFRTEKVTVTVKVKETKKVNMYLKPVTRQAQDSIAKDEDQALKLEAEGGREFNESVNKATNQNPFIKELPYIGPGFSWRIDYGAPDGLNDKKYPGEPVIFIRSKTTADQESALTWMRNSGYDPDKMNLVLTIGSTSY
ncbi:MAG TPA: hypothetical protein VF733_00410 [Candidatus Saccharimonadales bacterium]